MNVGFEDRIHGGERYFLPDPLDIERKAKNVVCAKRRTIRADYIRCWEGEVRFPSRGRKTRTWSCRCLRTDLM